MQTYGMTEAAHRMASNPLPPAARRPGSVGIATGVEIAILDERWRSLGSGEVGEVAIRGASVVDGYLDAPAANEAAFRDRWFRHWRRGFVIGRRLPPADDSPRTNPGPEHGIVLVGQARLRRA